MQTGVKNKHDKVSFLTTQRVNTVVCLSVIEPVRKTGRKDRRRTQRPQSDSVSARSPGESPGALRAAVITRRVHVTVRQACWRVGEENASHVMFGETLKQFSSCCHYARSTPSEGHAVTLIIITVILRYCEENISNAAVEIVKVSHSREEWVFISLTLFSIKFWRFGFLQKQTPLFHKLKLCLRIHPFFMLKEEMTVMSQGNVSGWKGMNITTQFLFAIRSRVFVVSGSSADSHKISSNF